MTQPSPLGVMQGRLLPKYKGRYQAHPKDTWKDEFPVAASLGLQLIEFILDYEDAEENPLLAPGGAAVIAQQVDKTGVAVRSVCADYFMEAPLHRQDCAENSLAILLRLIENTGTLGVSDIVIPCVDQSSLKTDDDVARLQAALKAALPRAEAANVNLALETDLAPDAFARLLEAIPNPRISVNYDIGNSAALGFKPEEEFEAYGNRITDIHIKDRTLGGGSVLLGTGNADFKTACKLIKKYKFSGPIIMQAFRDEQGVDICRKQILWIKKMWENHA